MSRANKRWPTIVSGVLVALAFFAYTGVLMKARAERARVKDWTPYAERFAFEQVTSTNMALYPQYGFADIGSDFRLPSRASWTLEPVDVPAFEGIRLFFTADEPLMYAADAGVRIFFAGREVGQIRARPVAARAGPFVPDLARESLLVPPAQAFGYEFPIPEMDGGCRVSCTVAVAGTFVTWRVYRVGLASETARFAIPASR